VSAQLEVSKPELQTVLNNQRSWGCVSALDAHGRKIWIADAHCDDGKRYVVRTDETLTAFVELERAIHEFALDLIS
jgi:hypothetical protein